MPYSSGGRINTNLGALNALNALNRINESLGMHQLRLATGRRINQGGDDPSGYVISKKMEGRIRALSAAVDNVGDAQSVLGVAEGAYQKVADLLTQMKDKQIRANNGAMGNDELTAIAAELNQLMTEINDINDNTKFNGTVLFLKTAGSTTYDKAFQVGEGSTEVLSVTFSAVTGATALLGVAAGSVTTANISSLTIDTGLATVSSEIGTVGAKSNRLIVKDENLNIAITNTAAAKSRIWDADIAKEQISSIKLQILQQTAMATLAQANQSPQVFLTLLR